MWVDNKIILITFACFIDKLPEHNYRPRIPSSTTLKIRQFVNVLLYIYPSFIIMQNHKELSIIK